MGHRDGQSMTIKRLKVAQENMALICNSLVLYSDGIQSSIVGGLKVTSFYFGDFIKFRLLNHTIRNQMWVVRFQKAIFFLV